jgi:hypothetical protein
MIKILRTTPVLSHMVLLTIALCLLGCGGSSVENPLRESEETDNTLTQVDLENQSLNVKVEVSKDTVQAGETVNMTATVDELRGSNVIFNWINTTGYGTLTPTGENKAIWSAPEKPDGVVKVEVLQLVVTAISQVVSVQSSGVDTDTEVLTSTKTILLTVTN